MKFSPKDGYIIGTDQIRLRAEKWNPETDEAPDFIISKKHIETTVTERNVSNFDLIKNKEVIVEKIENFIKKYGIPIYIKIDVEGYEYEVIQGLETAVPLISFEANLPEFCQESVNCISYLSSISSDKYMFNFTTDNFFLRDHFVKKDDAIKFLESTHLRYLEIYAQLMD